MRLFLAISFPPEIKSWLSQIQDGLRAHAVKGNFTRAENLHLTLHFLGEVPNGRVGTIRSALDAVSVPPFHLTLGGIGSFRRPGGELWWLGVERSEPLETLYLQLGNALRTAGFTVEQRPYKPHLTLAREAVLQDTFQKDALENHMGQRKADVRAVVLMKSERVQGVLRYTPIYEKSL